MATTSAQHSFLTPNTVFTIACVAFSILTVSIVFRAQSASPAATATEQLRESQTLERRPKAPPRRVAVDSIYGDPGLNNHNLNGRDDDEEQIGALSRLIGHMAGLTKKAKAVPEAAGMVGEVSLVTTALCRLQQRLLETQGSQSGGENRNRGFEACFTAMSTGLEASMLVVEAQLEARGSLDFQKLGQGVHQMRDQRSAVEFLMDCLTESVLPPTPPNETVFEAAIKTAENEHPGLQLPQQTPTGLTPGGDPKAWIEPPPEYSPPAASSLEVIAEKSDVKAPSEGSSNSSAEQHSSDGNDSALYDAVSENDSDLARELLLAGDDPNIALGELQRTPLHQAAHLNFCGCLQVLLRNGAEMSIEDAKGDTAVHLAAWAGNVEALSTLLIHGADVDFLSGRDGYSALWCAISASHIDVARLLLRHGARVSLRAASGDGLFPLHQAAVMGQSAMCELLLERGAQVDPLDNENNSPLHYAAATGSEATVRVLLRAGADMSLKQANGLTALHWAAHKGHTTVVAVLLDCGAVVDDKSEEGATALHLAANRGHKSVVRSLLERGANRKVVAKAWDGVAGTPAQIARAKGHGTVARLISQWSHV